jgi:hypothetical protein
MMNQTIPAARAIQDSPTEWRIELFLTGPSDQLASDLDSHGAGERIEYFIHSGIESSFLVALSKVIEFIENRSMEMAKLRMSGFQSEIRCFLSPNESVYELNPSLLNTLAKTGTSLRFIRINQGASVLA